MAAVDAALAGTVIDNFLATLSASCLYENAHDSPTRTSSTPRLAATAQPFAIHCTLGELLGAAELRDALRSRFPELFAALLTAVATYTNLGPPVPAPRSEALVPVTVRSKFGFGGGKESKEASREQAAEAAAAVALSRLVPCQIVVDAFQVSLAVF